jgi:hypothetical protein
VRPDKYQYVYNNPLRFTDPDGHCPVCIVAAIAAVAAGSSTVNAPGPKDPVYKSEGAGPVIAGVFLGEAAGKFVVAPLFRYAGSKLFTRTSVESVVKPTVVGVENASSAATIGRSIGQEVMKMESGQMGTIAAKVTGKGFDQIDAVTAVQTAITAAGKSSVAVPQADGTMVVASVMAGTNKPVLIVNANGVVSGARATINAGFDKSKGAFFEVTDIVPNK